MAMFNYGHVFASAGFSGGTWDISQGYNLTYTTTAGDLAFSSTGNTATLSTGTWPTGFVPGRVITTDDGTNAGPFTILDRDATGKILTLKETVVDDTPVGAVAVDGSADTGIQDVLLSAGDGALTEDTPHVLTSTGALGAPRTLDLSGMEVESSDHGGETLEGRFFYLAVLNDDVSATNSITISGSGTINGEASLTIENQGDYLFRYSKDGAWRVNVLPRPAEGIATLARVPFTAADWNLGTNLSEINLIQSGTPAAGEIGPHGLTAYDTYVIQVYNTEGTENEIVDVETRVDASGNITLLKGRAKAGFDGEVVIVGSLD